MGVLSYSRTPSQCVLASALPAFAAANSGKSDAKTHWLGVRE